MKVGRILLIVLSAIAAGCSSSYQVRVDEPSNNDRVFNYRQVNNWVSEGSGVVICTFDTSYEVSSAFIREDSTILTEARSGLGRTIATGRIVTIRRTDYGAGALTGGLLGALGGTVALIMVRAADSGGDWAGSGYALLAPPVLGAAIGALIGSNVGGTQECRFRSVTAGSHSRVDSTERGAAGERTR